MNIPDKVKIGWKDYKIEHASSESKLTVESGTCYGEIDYNEQIIRLNDKYSEEQKQCTLVHEVLHGISDMYQLNMPEGLVARLADAIYTVVKDNPNMLK